MVKRASCAALLPLVLIPLTFGRALADTPKEKLKIRRKSAGIKSPLGGDARPYAEARKQLARGQAGAALRALRRSKTGLFIDREALLKGDALLALGNLKGAKNAYLKALQNAQLSSIAISAARGLVNVLGQLKDRKTQLEYIDALLGLKNPPNPASLKLEKARALLALGQKDVAVKVAFEILISHPASGTANSAEQLLKKLKGVKVPDRKNEAELKRIGNLIRARAFKRAERAMDALKSPKLKTAVGLKQAELYKRKRERDKEEALLLKLSKEKLSRSQGAKVFERLGRLAMGRDDDAAAIARFDALKARYPKTRRAIEGEYLAGWIPYNAGNYSEATRRMLAFADEHRKSPRRTEALWYAGWSAYLGKQDGLARRAFEQLIEDHPESQLIPHAHYWQGRIRHRGGNVGQAKTEYREVLKLGTLSYYGFWAMTRLEQLGEKVVFTAPPPAPRKASLRATVRHLGEDRPVLIDRAVLLHKARLFSLARQELTEAARYFRSVKDYKGRTMVADMLEQLGAHNLAFRIALGIAQDGGDLVTGKPYAWRAWRHAYPEAFPKEVQAAQKAHEVDQHLILSIMRTESHFRPWVRSPVGARGLMQLMPNTARRIGKRVKKGRYHAARYKNPASNVWLGTWYISSLLDRYADQVHAAAGAYNAGPGAMDRWLNEFGSLPLDEFVERVPYRETRRYIRRVLETYMVYKRLNGKALPNLLAKLNSKPVKSNSVNF